MQNNKGSSYIGVVTHILCICIGLILGQISSSPKVVEYPISDWNTTYELLTAPAVTLEANASVQQLIATSITPRYVGVPTGRAMIWCLANNPKSGITCSDELPINSEHPIGKWLLTGNTVALNKTTNGWAYSTELSILIND